MVVEVSGFIGTTGATTTLVNFMGHTPQGTDWRRLCGMDFRDSGAIFIDCISAVAPVSFETEWWPNGGGFAGDRSVDGGLLQKAAQWGWFNPAAGASSRYAFAGITRDALGTAIPLVTVKAYRTSDDSLQGSAVSDGNGFFFINTLLYPDQHYLVAHKTGSPDVDGVSINTLIGI